MKEDKNDRNSPIESGLVQQMQTGKQRSRRDHGIQASGGTKLTDEEWCQRSARDKWNRSESWQWQGGLPCWSNVMELPAIWLTSTSTVDEKIRIESRSRKRELVSIWVLNNLLDSVCCCIIRQCGNTDSNAKTGQVFDTTNTRAIWASVSKMEMSVRRSSCMGMLSSLKVSDVNWSENQHLAWSENEIRPPNVAKLATGECICNTKTCPSCPGPHGYDWGKYVQLCIYKRKIC